MKKVLSVWATIGIWTALFAIFIVYMFIKPTPSAGLFNFGGLDIFLGGIGWFVGLLVIIGVNIASRGKSKSVNNSEKNNL